LQVSDAIVSQDVAQAPELLNNVGGSSHFS